MNVVERAMDEAGGAAYRNDSAFANAKSSLPLPALISARLERLPIVRWQILVRCVIGVVTFFDAFDMLMISYVLPVISKEWQLSQYGSTWAIVSGSAGMLVGAVGLGWLADRFGRVRVIVVALLVYSMTSLALAFSPGYEVFIGLRFLQGVGIGGEVPVAATYINEIARAHKRGMFVLLYEMIFPLGVAVHGLVATLVVPTLGWRWLFVIGALPLPMVFLIRKYVPESPRWLASKGHTQRALETMDYIEQQVSKYVKGPLPEVRLPVASKAPARGTWRDLFKPPYLQRTMVLWTMWFTLSFVHLGIVNWLPTLYMQQFGLSLKASLAYAAINPWFALLGGFFVAMVIDRFGRRFTLGTALAACGLILFFLSLSGPQSFEVVAVSCALLAFSSTIVITGLYLYTPELYPTRFRAMGASFGGVWSRLGAIAGPATFGFLLHATTSLSVGFAVLGAVGLIGGILALIFSEETSGRVLEEISPE